MCYNSSVQIASELFFNNRIMIRRQRPAILRACDLDNLKHTRMAGLCCLQGEPMNSTDKVTYIYALIDPRDGQPRYVGKTIDPTKRLNGHINPKRKCNCHSANWIRQLVKAGFMPEMKIIEEVKPGDDWKERERFWIQKYQEMGYSLTNITPGGDGGGYVGRTQSLETREKLRRAKTGKRFPPEFGAKVSAARKGKFSPLQAKALEIMHENNKEKKRTPETCQKMGAWQKGRKRLPETVAKMRAANLGKKATPEARQKMSQSRRGKVVSEETRKKRSLAMMGRPGTVCGVNNPHAKLTPDLVRELRRRYKAGGISMEKLGELYGITHNAVYQIVKGLSWKSVGMESEE